METPAARSGEARKDLLIKQAHLVRVIGAAVNLAGRQTGIQPVEVVDRPGDFRDAVAVKLLVNLTGGEAQDLPAGGRQVVVAQIVIGGLFGVGVVAVAVGFDVDIFRDAIDREIEDIVLVAGAEIFLPLGRDMPALQGRP